MARLLWERSGCAVQPSLASKLPTRLDFCYSFDASQPLPASFLRGLDPITADTTVSTAAPGAVPAAVSAAVAAGEWEVYTGSASALPVHGARIGALTVIRVAIPASARAAAEFVAAASASESATAPAQGSSGTTGFVWVRFTKGALTRLAEAKYSSLTAGLPLPPPPQSLPLRSLLPARLSLLPSDYVNTDALEAALRSAAEDLLTVTASRLALAASAVARLHATLGAPPLAALLTHAPGAVVARAAPSAVGPHAAVALTLPPGALAPALEALLLRRVPAHVPTPPPP